MEARKNICITTDCVCDLPSNWLKDNEVDVLYFYIQTDTGRFRDVSEISSRNIFEYLSNGGEKIMTGPPEPDEIAEFFTEKLKTFDELIYIAVSSGISVAVKNAKEAVDQMGSLGERVHIIDSLHLSTGIGHIVIRAVEMVRNGVNDSATIIAELEKMKKSVTTSFMADSAQYLYRNGKISGAVYNICSLLNIHPVLGMKNGILTFKSAQFGNYEKSALRYIRKELKTPGIKTDRLFITHAGCTASDIKLIKHEVNRIMKFDSIIVTDASGAISGNSGPRTFGLLYNTEN